MVRLHFDGEHYVTLTGIDKNDMVRVFDPYYLDQPLDTDGVQMVYDHPCEYNRLVPRPASSVRPTRFTRLARLTPAKPFSCLMTRRA